MTRSPEDDVSQGALPDVSEHLHTDDSSPGPNRRRYVVAGLVGAGLAAAAAGAWWRRSGGAAGLFGGGSPDAGTLLGVALPDESGTDTPLAQWRGKLLIVNFWATWCTPCREEMPRFVDLQNRYGARGLQFVGIAVDQADKVRAFTSEIGLNYPSLIGGHGAIELSRTLGNRLGALPFTVVVDRAGKIAHTQLGPMNDAQIVAIIGQLI